MCTKMYLLRPSYIMNAGVRNFDTNLPPYGKTQLLTSRLSKYGLLLCIVKTHALLLKYLPVGTQCCRWLAIYMVQIGNTRHNCKLCKNLLTSFRLNFPSKEIQCRLRKDRIYVTHSGKRCHLVQKFKIALSILFKSATHAAYNEENHTFIAASVPAVYTKTHAP